MFFCFLHVDTSNIDVMIFFGLGLGLCRAVLRPFPVKFGASIDHACSLHEVCTNVARLCHAER